MQTLLSLEHAKCAHQYRAYEIICEAINPLISCTEAFFLVCMSNHRPRAVTIKSSLKSEYGFSHEPYRLAAMALVWSHKLQNHCEVEIWYV